MNRVWSGVGIAFGSILFAAAALSLLPVFGTTAKRGFQTKNLSNAKQLAVAAKLFADDNGGRFPLHLKELIPEYVDAESWKRLLYAGHEDANGAPIPAFDWLYFGACFDENHPPPILIASPKSFVIQDRKCRTVMLSDTSGSFVPEEEYEELLRKTIEAMRQRRDGVERSTVKETAQ